MLFQSSRRLNRWRSNNSYRDLVHGLMSAGQRWSLHPAEHPSVPRARRQPLGRHRPRSNFWAFQFPKTGHGRSRNRFQQRSGPARTSPSLARCCQSVDAPTPSMGERDKPTTKNSQANPPQKAAEFCNRISPQADSSRHRRRSQKCQEETSPWSVASNTLPSALVVGTGIDLARAVARYHLFQEVPWGTA
jgi:hypothetical protein